MASEQLVDALRAQIADTVGLASVCFGHAAVKFTLSKLPQIARVSKSVFLPESGLVDVMPKKKGAAGAGARKA